MINTAAVVSVLFLYFCSRRKEGRTDKLQALFCFLLLLITPVSSLFPMHLGYTPHKALIIVGFKLTS